VTSAPVEVTSVPSNATLVPVLVWFIVTGVESTSKQFEGSVPLATPSVDVFEYHAPSEFVGAEERALKATRYLAFGRLTENCPPGPTGTIVLAPVGNPLGEEQTENAYGIKTI
jgi:hypothetical protein